MATVSTSLGERARSIFADLGYSVSREGREFRAKRKWRVVRVTPVTELDDLPSSGELRCFVTWDEDTETLERRLRREQPAYDWAVIGVREDGGYVVSRRSA